MIGGSSVDNQVEEKFKPSSRMYILTIYPVTIHPAVILQWRKLCQYLLFDTENDANIIDYSTQQAGCQRHYFYVLHRLKPYSCSISGLGPSMESSYLRARFIVSLWIASLTLMDARLDVFCGHLTVDTPHIPFQAIFYVHTTSRRVIVTYAS